MDTTTTELSTQSHALPTSGILRLGIIGCSLGRSRYHLALQACRSIRIAGIADTDEKRTRIWARDIGNRVPAYATIEALLDAASTFDALLIASPLMEREAHTLAALKLNKPLLVEAPFSTRLNSPIPIDSPLLIPALPRRIDPWFKAAETQVRSDIVGTIQQIRCHWSFPIESVDETEETVTGGWNGILRTLGTQTADLCRHWLGEALSVSGDIDLQELAGTGGAISHRRSHTDKALANLIVTHEHGQSTHHFSRTRAVKADERYNFIGSTGNLELIVSAGAAASSASAPALSIHYPGQRQQQLPISISVPSVGKVPLSVASSRIVSLLDLFAQNVLTGSRSILRAQDALAAFEIVQAGYLSSRERMKISLPLNSNMS